MAVTPTYAVGDKLVITNTTKSSHLEVGQIVTVAFIDYDDPSLTYKSKPYAKNEYGSWFGDKHCRRFVNTPGEDCIF